MKFSPPINPRLDSKFGLALHYATSGLLVLAWRLNFMQNFAFCHLAMRGLPAREAPNCTYGK